MRWFRGGAINTGRSDLGGRKYSYFRLVFIGW